METKIEKISSCVKELEITATEEEIKPFFDRIIANYSKKINVPEKLVVVKHIYSKFGFTGAKIIVHIYKNEADMNKFEHKGLLEKQTGKKKKGAPGEEAAE